MLIKGSNQTLIIETGKDLSGITSPKIRYQKPTGAVGSFVAVADGTTLTKKFATSDLDEAGTWMFQPEVTSAGDLLIGRDKVKVTVARPIANPE